ncbi:solute carrier family 23 member 1-like isoform X1 [Asterias rubens]|uniref:solute carrier family 23 member 1-like isoform X1 n=1 Tax=Asterias rubens TaxID=7604 RepID=UPI0014558C90|nr:solute carrier family 23 member 1-like isoform X1 [Asterias rubens]
MDSTTNSSRVELCPSISKDKSKEYTNPIEKIEENGGTSHGPEVSAANGVDLEMGDLNSNRKDRDYAKREAAEILKDLRGDLTYAIDDVPPWYTCLLLGFQHYLTMFGATVAIPLLLAEPLCIKNNYLAQGELIGTIFAVSGLVTLFQTTFGVRLPIVQGGTFSFLGPALAILGQVGECPAEVPNDVFQNMTLAEQEEVTLNETEVWHSRMRIIQGSIMVASIFEVIVGFSGIVGIMLKYIGPMTIAPTITLVGLSLFGAASDFSSGHWGIAFLTIGLMALFSQYIARFGIPFCGFSKEKGCHRISFPLFKMFPVILSIVVSWAFAAILTVTNVFPTDPNEYGYLARTDLRIGVLRESAWIRVPYPGQWGIPTITIAGIFGMLAGVIASIFESVGDYYACARLSGAPPPPVHAINRGIGIEGLGCILAGAFGSGSGTTSYGENIGALGITKVGSLRAIQFGGALMIAMGMFAKFGALFVTIPDPIVGGMFCVMFAMVTAVGISNLQFVNLNSSRNLFVIGFSLIMGFIIPFWVRDNESFINTGVTEIDQILIVLLETNMFIGGFLGFILDNTIPGSDEDRGIAQWRNKYGGADQDPAVTEEILRCYDFPVGMKFLRKFNFLRFFPMCPMFNGCGCTACCCKRESPSIDNKYTTVPAVFIEKS